MGSKQEEPEIFVQVKLRITVGSQECDGKAPMTKVLQWVGTDSLGTAGKERELSFMRKISRHTWGSALGWIASQSRAYELEGGQTCVMSWLSATGCFNIKNKQINPSYSRRNCIFISSCLHGTLLVTLISSGRAVQQATSSPGNL